MYVSGEALKKILPYSMPKRGFTWSCADKHRQPIQVLLRGEFVISILIVEMSLRPFRSTNITVRAYRKAGYLTMVIAGYIPANSQLAAAIATIVKSLSIGK